MIQKALQGILRSNRIGHFDQLSPLGQGGFGVVLKARDMLLDRTVALKIPFDQSDVYDQVLAEGRILAGLNHPNILPIYSAQRASIAPSDEVFFLVCEFAAGGDLSRLPLLKLKQFELLGLLAQIAGALGEAHKHGILHADVKPQNVLLLEPVHSLLDCRVKLGDFGIALRIGKGNHGPLGSLSFMPPEQWLGMPLPESDIYALGVSAYYLGSGQFPFRGANADEISRQHFKHNPPPLCTLNDGISKPFSDLIRQCLDKNPSQRPSNGDVLLQEFLRLMKKETESLRKPSSTGNPLPATRCSVLIDDIIRSECHAIAYSANSKLHFGGGVSRALLEACGPQLKTAAIKALQGIPDGILPAGSAISTPAFKLEKSNTKIIIHAASLNWNPYLKAFERNKKKGYLDDIANAVYSACRLAEQSTGIESLALPLFGLRVGIKQHQNLNEQDVIAANVQGVFRYLLQSNRSGCLQYPRKLRTITISVYVPSDPKSTARIYRILSSQLDWIRFRVGELTRSNVEALVISANNWLSPGSGNARAVYDRAGSVFRKTLKEARTKCESYPRGAAITLPGGELADFLGNRRFLIHTVATLYEKRHGKSRRVPASPRDVYLATRNALHEALKSGARSVAIPLMCSRPGYHILKDDQEAPVVMARTIIEAINDMRTDLGEILEHIELVFPTRDLQFRVATGLGF